MFLSAFQSAESFLKDMIKSMAHDPIVFAMANPDPEITYDDAVSVRSDIIMATGRSDYPNQVNNVLGFPFIFRGALDVKASAINEEMKMAAVRALAELTKEKVPEIVFKAYGGKEFTFGRHYIIPKPFDPRVLWKVAPAVARAAMETGVARVPIEDWTAYENELKDRLGLSKEIIRTMIQKAQKDPKRIVFPEGEEDKIIRAAHEIFEDKMAYPILLGNKDNITAKIETLGFELNEFEIIDPLKSDLREKYAAEYYDYRKRKGVIHREALKTMRNNNYFGSMMVKMGDADSLVGGITAYYGDTLRPALQCLGVKEGFKVVSGLYIVLTKRNIYFFADASVNINPTEEELAEIAISAADTVKGFDVIPKVAMLSFSNFGSAVHPESIKVKNATALAKKLRPDLIIDGEIQADTAVMPSILEKDFPFSPLKGGANVLIFPDLASGNIAYKLMARLGEATVIGPILMGIKKPVQVLQRGSSVEEIINMTAIAVVDAQK